MVWTGRFVFLWFAFVNVGLTAFVLSAFFCCDCIVTWDCTPDKHSSFSETGRGQRWGLRNKCSRRSIGYRIKFSPYASQVRVDLLSRGNWEWSKDRKSDIYTTQIAKWPSMCALVSRKGLFKKANDTTRLFCNIFKLITYLSKSVHAKGTLFNDCIVFICLGKLVYWIIYPSLDLGPFPAFHLFLVLY